MFAVIQTGGKQYRVAAGARIKVEKLAESVRKNKTEVVFSEVLLVADESGKATVGKPFVPGARVEATVVKDGRAKKILIVKYKPKTRYKRTAGHRQPFTEVLVNKIVSQ